MPNSNLFFKQVMSLLMLLAAPAHGTSSLLDDSSETIESLIYLQPDYCPPYTESAIFRPRSHTVRITPGDRWMDLIEDAGPDTEFLFEDGVYVQTREVVNIGDTITLRSASGNRDAVVIKGTGYSKPGQGLIIAGDNVTIADLTITQLRDHGLYVKPELGGGMAPNIYNVKVIDIGTQHIKSNKGSRQGIVACSSLGYTADGIRGDYNGAIDLHGALAWTIRDNEIYNISGDGSGCNVRRDCGSYISSPAILVWNQSRDTVVERNTITESFRNIAFGLGKGHEGGIIRENVIVRQGSGDAGIELQGASGVLVENNTVLLYDNYPGAIEYRDSRDITVISNTVSTAPLDRGNNVGMEVSNNEILSPAEGD